MQTDDVVMSGLLIEKKIDLQFDGTNPIAAAAPGFVCGKCYDGVAREAQVDASRKCQEIRYDASLINTTNWTIFSALTCDQQCKTPVSTAYAGVDAVRPVCTALSWNTDSFFTHNI